MRCKSTKKRRKDKICKKAFDYLTKIITFVSDLQRTLLIPVIALNLSAFSWGQTTHVIPSSSTIANIQTPRTDTWTAFHNPASLTVPHVVVLSAQYENRYMLSELNTALIQAAYTNPYVNVGVAFSFFGYAKYQEMMTGVTLSRSFQRFPLGIQANYITIYCGDEIKYRGTFIPQVGATINITQRIVLGIHTFNPFGQRIRLNDTQRRTLPAVYSIGIDYQPITQLHWTTQADYDIRSTFRIATAFEWQAIQPLSVKIGLYYQQLFVGCMGLGITWDKFTLDTNFELHPRLGLVCQARITYILPCDKPLPSS